MEEVNCNRFIKLLDNEKIGNVLIDINEHGLIFFRVKIDDNEYVYKPKYGYTSDVGQFCTDHFKHCNVDINKNLFRMNIFKYFTDLNVWHNGNYKVFLENDIYYRASDDIMQKFNIISRIEKFLSLGVFHIDDLKYNVYNFYMWNWDKFIQLLQKYNVPIDKRIYYKVHLGPDRNTTYPPIWLQYE